MHLVTRRTVCLAILCLLVVAPLRAQTAAPAGSDSSANRAEPVHMAQVTMAAIQPVIVAAPEASVTTGAPLVGLRTGVHTRETARPLQPTFAPDHANLGRNRALMVVGAAGIITGAIIGGDAGTIFMVGGAIVGIYGLYNYLQ